MSAWLAGFGAIVSLELRQRVRGVAWYILLGVFFVLVGVVTLVLAASLGTWAEEAGGGIYSAVVYFVLLLATLVSPALSGNAVNGDRDAGTLATTQVTLVSTTQLVLGKLAASWVSSVAFLVVAIPFLLVASAFGGVRADTVLVSILVLLIEMGVVSALGVGLSGLLRRPLFSIVVTYLAVALLSVGSLIGFGLAGLAIQTSYTYRYETSDYTGIDEMSDEEPACIVEEQESTVPRYDMVWWMLAANPYVVLADAVPTHYDGYDSPDDLFGYIKLGVRSLQTPLFETAPEDVDCDLDTYRQGPSGREVIEGSVPSWFVGLGIHVLMGAAAIGGAIAVTRTPSRRLAAGSRVA
ncbi:ABC transporter permease [Homoserinibacter sp. YIM 151385]|uniref:ABC transporter permease n=1 Tax=Homoserinibacter sp. YIM 151385 TaxID=2985506 RepID=UPI0022F0AA80|nr:ABC transporter permease [Homoserinibacter sp. YIM 151385]WBU38040.1 ABC transporter permease [Homoserinibacter sp. YIM 151385]